MRANVSAHPSFLTYRLQKVSSDITNLPTGGRLTDGSIQVPLNSAQSINPVTLKYCPMIQDTSLWAYSVATKDLGAKQKEVLNALRLFPDATNAEIAARLG